MEGGQKFSFPTLLESYRESFLKVLLRPKTDLFCFIHISKVQVRIIDRAMFQVKIFTASRNWLAAITQFKNGRGTILRLGSRGSDVKRSTRVYVCMQGDRSEGSCALVRTLTHA